MTGAVRGLIEAGRRVMSWADAACNRLYGWRWNPIYQTGTIAVLLFLVLLATGLYLLIFYRIGDPYGSVARITEQAWTGRWIRALHRYASAGVVVAVLLHAVRMLLQDRHWGARAMAWISGIALLFLVMVVGWTGYVMVWDAQAQLLAREGARFLDALPIFTEPVSRMFTGEAPMPRAFFFLNLFLHIALPLGLALLLWIHVSKMARPVLLPPKGLTLAILGLLLAVSVIWPVGMGPAADLLRIPREAELDLTYNFWLPFTGGLPAWVAWAVGSVAAAALLLMPYWARPREEEVPEPSWVDPRLCTGCDQCFQDCPWEAIAMVDRTDGRPGRVALVDPSVCARCGICAGSCAPMGVGPPGATGRDQLDRVRAFLADRAPGPRDVVVIACERGAGDVARTGLPDGLPVYPVRCAGSVHTSVVEFLLRGGAGGVLVAACPPRDCWNREGTKWLEARMYRDREAELKTRVDRRRLAVAAASAGEGREVREAALALRERVRALAPEVEEFDLITECRRSDGAEPAATHQEVP